ncbi:NB-ARC domain-containing protein [Amycolatopsis sp. NPDC049868]|uniref:NB-ARC domain-containing protein n=1 Tax=Amycolatopsis sp. NPDC049868 TaxID=3363934 RepID=UPI0037AD76A5
MTADEAGLGPSLFGSLLLAHRKAAGMSQAELARASGITDRTVRDLERGRTKAAQRRSAEILADALALTGDERESFLSAAKDGRRRAARTSEIVAGNRFSQPAVPDLLGREFEWDQIRLAAGAGGAVTAIVGPPGVGKTALAMWAAHQLVPDFPGGILSIDLRGMDQRPVTVRVALDRLLRALGVPPAQIPTSEVERSNLYRRLLGSRRVVVLLDNAADEAQVRPLLARSSGCLTLVTSRVALAGLEAVRWLRLSSLTSSDAVGMLTTIVGAERIAAEPEAAAELVALCGYLPLAVRIVGNRLVARPHWSLTYLVTQLRDESTRLSSLRAGDLQVRSAFEMSYRRLSPAARLVFRRLAAIPGADFGTELAEVATGMTDIHLHLDELVDAGLLQGASVAGRFRFHDLIGIFAVDRRNDTERPEECERQDREVREHLLGTATAAGRVLLPETLDTQEFRSRQEAADWLEREGVNWTAALRRAARQGQHREVLDLGKAMHWYSGIRTQEFPWDEIFEYGVTAARALGSRHEEAMLSNFLGWAHFVCRGEDEVALTWHREALTIAVEIGDRVEEGWAHVYQGVVMLCFARIDEALVHARKAHDLFGELAFWARGATAKVLLGRCLLATGNTAEALEVHRGALSACETHRSEASPEVRRWIGSHILGSMGQVLMKVPDPRRAAEAFRRARELYREGGLHLREANAALSEGIAWRAAGNYAEAHQCLSIAAAMLTGVSTRTQYERAMSELARLPEC